MPFVFGNSLEKTKNFSNISIMSDEAYFQFNGTVNTQNARIHCKQNPRTIDEVELHPFKCTALCVRSKALLGLISLKMTMDVRQLLLERDIELCLNFFAFLRLKIDQICGSIKIEPHSTQLD